MRRVVLVLATALAIGVSAASPHAQVDWKRLPYMDFASQHFLVATDGQWGGRVVPVFPNQRPLPMPGPGLRTTTPKWIWTAACTTTAGSTTFSRTVYAPGDPREGRLTFAVGFGRNLPFTSGVFTINGIEAARLTPDPKRRGGPMGFAGQLDARALKAFKYGANVLSIRLQRNAMQKGQGCSSPHRLVAAYAMLELRFTPGIVAVPSPLGESQIALTAEKEQRKSIHGSAVFRNKGPSGSPGGTFVFDWLASGVRGIFGVPSVTGLTGCKTDDEGESAGTLECEYRDFPVGKTLTVQLRGVAELPSGWGQRSSGVVTLRWQIRSPGGNFGSSAAHHTIYICGSETASPDCKKKP